MSDYARELEQAYLVVFFGGGQKKKKKGPVSLHSIQFLVAREHGLAGALYSPPLFSFSHIRAMHARPLYSAALASVLSGVILVRV